MVIDIRKSIKVTPEVYDRMERLRAKRETFNELIDRLLSTVEIWRTIADKFNQDPEVKRIHGEVHEKCKHQESAGTVVTQ